MRPVTKLEKEVAMLSSHLLPPTMEQIVDAQQHMFTPKAYYTKKYGYVCLDCGGQFRVPVLEDNTTIICPHCGKTLKPEHTRKYRETASAFYMLMQTIHHEGKEFVVQRLFEVCKHMKRGEAATYTWWDIAEYFTVEGKQICLGIPKFMFGRWNYWGDLTIKKPNRDSYYCYGGSYSSYRFMPDYMCIESVSSVLQRNGFQGNYENYIPQYFVELLMCNPKAEQLYKLDHRLIDFFSNDILSQAKIANRHHYRISDPSMWVDTIKLLRRLGMDDRNPKHICPEDLRAFHNEILEKHNRKVRKEAEIRQRELEARRREDELRRLEQEKEIAEEYIKRMARFLNLHIQDELIDIKPIPTVPAVHEEGEAMHHCVFTNGYYKHRNVLLLSARDKFGNRVETIEVNLDSYSVAQSRGRHNSNTDYHDRILSLMSQSMGQIKELHLSKSKAA